MMRFSQPQSALSLLILTVIKSGRNLVQVQATLEYSKVDTPGKCHALNRRHQQLPPPSHRSRGRLSRGRPSYRRYHSLVAVLFLLLLIAALPRQSHAGPGAACDCQFDDNACFPADGDDLRTAVNLYTAGNWNGQIDGTGDNYGTDISRWCVDQVTNMRGLFQGKTGFDANLSQWNTKSVIVMRLMFDGASSFTGDGIGDWDVSQVTDMSYMFAGATEFTGGDDGIGEWVVSKVTSMKFIFNGASSFIGDGIGSWDVSQVTDMSYMFSSATEFTGGDDGIGEWNVSKVTNMLGMFLNASSFTGDGIGKWVVSKVTSMKGMFNGASSFTGGDDGIGGWVVSNVEDMMQMFRSASSFIGDGIGDWNLSKVTKMGHMFAGATKFTGGDDGIGKWDVSNVADMSYMFYRASSFTGDGIWDWDVSNVEDMRNMFFEASVFNQNLCAWGDNFPYDNAGSIFSGGTSCEFPDTPILDNDYGGPFCASDCGVPSMQPSGQPSLSRPPSEPPSMTPSQTPSDVPSTKPSSKPSSAPSCSPSASPTSTPSIVASGVNPFYPRWMNGDEGCRNDGEEPGYMATNSVVWLFSTLEACCKAHFGGYAFNSCMGRDGSLGLCNESLFYPDWEGDDKTCLNDGQEPEYIISNYKYYLSNTLDECCEKFYSWDLLGCKGITPVLTNGDFYPDWENGSQSGTCLNDGNFETYMLNDQDYYLSPTLEQCCKKHFSWNLSKCVGSSTTSGTNTDTSDLGSKEWYVDWQSYSCVQDCVGSNPCGGLAEFWEETYASVDICCRTKLSWIRLSACRQASMN